MKETKSAKFKRLRDARLPRTVHAIELIGNLAGAAYESTPAEAEELVGQLERAVATVAERFGVEPSVQAPEEAPAFTLSDEKPAAPARPELTIGRAEGLALIRFGPKIDEAMNAIRDGRTDEALRLLGDVMTS